MIIFLLLLLVFGEARFSSKSVADASLMMTSSSHFFEGCAWESRDGRNDSLPCSVSFVSISSCLKSKGSSWMRDPSAQF